jgi:capsular polysaccharide transport system permease protein
MSASAFVARQSRIVTALMLRELITRYGRRGLGFAWLIAEPLLFCLGVIVLWSVARPEYEHGLRMGPFVMTGYMCLLLLRHQITLSLSALQANVGLLHHRGIAVLHICIARNLLEFLGTTAAFAVVYAVLMVLGQVSAPQDWLLLYGGWLLLAFMSAGLALIFAALALRFEVMERIVPLFTYILIPMSGVFFMAAWVPAAYREAFLLIPLPHPVEMVRAGVFGEFVATHFDPLYALGWSVVFVFVGLLLLGGARERIDAE